MGSFSACSVDVGSMLGRCRVDVGSMRGRCRVDNVWVEEVEKKIEIWWWWDQNNKKEEEEEGRG